MVKKIENHRYFVVLSLAKPMKWNTKILTSSTMHSTNARGASIMSSMATSSASSSSTAGVKRKEIYKYEAPWTVFSMNWSVRPDKRFR